MTIFFTQVLRLVQEVKKERSTVAEIPPTDIADPPSLDPVKCWWLNGTLRIQSTLSFFKDNSKDHPTIRMPKIICLIWNLKTWKSAIFPSEQSSLWLVMMTGLEDTWHQPKFEGEKFYVIAKIFLIDSESDPMMQTIMSSSHSWYGPILRFVRRRQSRWEIQNLKINNRALSRKLFVSWQYIEIYIATNSIIENQLSVYLQFYMVYCRVCIVNWQSGEMLVREVDSTLAIGPVNRVEREE